MKMISGTKERASTRIPPPRLLLWRRDVAQALGISLRTLDKFRSSGQIPPPDVLLGGRMGWRAKTIETWLEERRPGQGISSFSSTQIETHKE